MDPKSLVITDQRLGKGGFGSVFVCQLGEKKVAAKKLSQSKEEIGNLSREASKLRRLRFGKYITYIYGITMKDESFYMVMECSEYGDLQRYLKRNKESVTYEQKILFCRGILLGVLYCHSMKIFHGDIKCENVILGKNLEPKLTDFGLSVTVDNIAYYKNLYKGSFYWAAPELFSIRDEMVYQEFIADPYPCDVYSLGATFCEISCDGTTEFIVSDEPGIDIIAELVYPIPKNAFLQEIVDRCCQFERNERISLDECLSALDIAAERQLPIPNIDDEWRRIQQGIKANSKLESPPSFILYRPSENLIIGPSNLSLLEWLCIKDCTEAVKYMIRLHNSDEKQLKWLYNISVLCSSLNTAGFLRNMLQDNTAGPLALSGLIDLNPWQLIEAFIKAGANCNEEDLLSKAVIGHYNKIVQLHIENASSYRKAVIHKALKCGNAEAVRILADYIGLEFRDTNGDTPLLAAINAGNVEIVKILLDHKVNVHSKNNRPQRISRIGGQQTPLYRAAVKGNHEMVELLINAGATIDTEDSKWHSLVQDLEQQGENNIVQLIRSAMGKQTKAAENYSTATSISNSRGENEKSAEVTPLCTVIRNGQSDLVQKLINGGADANEHSYDGYSPLHWAVVVGGEEIVGTLLRAGANIDAKTPNEKKSFYTASSFNHFNRYTPLHIATVKRHLGIVKILIESGANFSLKNKAGQTIMDIADKEDKSRIESIIRECAPVTEDSFPWILDTMSMETVITLISSANTNMETLNHFLCISVYRGNVEAINYLLEYVTNVNSDYEGKSPLEWAISGGHAQIVQILIDQGADIHSKRNNNYNSKSIIEVLENYSSGKKDKAQALLGSPLHQAAALSNVEIVKILLNAGVDADARDYAGYNALYYAALCGCDEVVALLHNKGAKVRLWKKIEDSDAIYKTAKHIVHKAAETGKVNTEKIFTDAGARVNFENKSNSTLFHAAVLNKNEMTAASLQNNNVFSSSNFDKIAALTEAVRSNQSENVKLLLNSGTDVNAKNAYGMTPLFECVDESLVDMVQFLIEKGADVNARNEDGFTPIHYAKDKEVAEILISHGADINTKSVSGLTPLFGYVIRSLIDMIQFLIEKGADVNTRDKHGYAPIHFAKNREVTEFLISHGANINTKNINGATPLFGCIKESLTDMVQLLIEKGADVNARDKDGFTPIHNAKDREVAEILISHGADINTKSTNGGTPLFECVEELLTDMVQFLIEKGADVNARDKHGYAPIHFAKDKEVAETLISHGADTNTKNINGATPLFGCIKESLADMVQLLIEKGADVNARDKHGYAPIHFAKNREVTEFLISHGANINIKNINGATPLFGCIKESLTDIVQFLIEKGADVNTRDKDGFTPIHNAKDREVAEILISHGADINTKNINGATLLFGCIKESLTDIVQFLIEKGADINTRDKYGYAPIHFVKNREIAEILISHGADINTKNINGATPLFGCIKESLTDIVQFLIEKGADVNTRDKDGYAPIHFVKNREVAEFLISHGADINTKNINGATPLFGCIKESLTDMVQFLIEKGADVNARDKHGYAPIHFAKDKEVAEFLISHGADINTKSTNGGTPLFECVEESLTDMVQLLVKKGVDVNARDKDGFTPIHNAKDREVAEILISHGADINAKSKDGKTLFNILLEEQNKNLSSATYNRKEVSELLEYLRSLNKNNTL